MRLPYVLAATLAVTAQAAAAQTPVFDLHVHLWNGEASLRAYEEQLKEQRQTVVGFGAMWFGGPNQALAGDPERVRAGNNGALALAVRHSEVMPIATVHPYDGPTAIAELTRVAARGIKVLKLHPHTQKFDPADPRVLSLVRKAGELGIIVLMDNASIIPGDCEKLFNLALDAPKTTFIFAHLGGLNFRFWNILKAARTAKGLLADNIYFDVSATVVIVADSPIEEEFVWTIRNVGIDHVLLGSDYPQYSLEQNLSALDRLSLDANEKAKIRLGNAQRLFGLTASKR
jgi:predicted TIM-barrel fold metal-dependent hydrolase